MRATPLILFLLGCTAPTTDVQPHALGSESPFGLDVEMSWPNERASDLQLVHDSGTGAVRLVLFWGGFEPDPPTGEPRDVMGHKSGDHTYNWNWAGFEDLVDDLHAQGKQIVFTQLFNPTWSNGAPSTCETGPCGFFCDARCGNPPTNPAYYEDYIYNLVSHFGDRVTFYSMGNEPNLRIFYNPQPPYAAGSIPAQYIADYGVAFDRALHAASPDAKSFGPELSRLDGDVSWSTWWNTMIGAYAQYWDVISQHYYESDSKAVRDLVDKQIKPSLASRGLLGVKPFWITELGYTSCRGDQYQSDQIYGSHVDMFNRISWWQRIFTHSPVDLPGEQCGHGLVHAPDAAYPSVRKPAFLRYQQMTGRAFPAIAAAGTGCDDGYCIWITGSNFRADSYVDLRRPGESALLASYSDLGRSLDGSPQVLTLRLDPDHWDELDTTGLDVWVVNPSDGTWSSSAHVQR